MGGDGRNVGGSTGFSSSVRKKHFGKYGSVCSEQQVQMATSGRNAVCVRYVAYQIIHSDAVVHHFCAHFQCAHIWYMHGG